MEMIVASVSGLSSFLLYFGIALIDLVIFKYVYSAVTPHKEWALIQENNTAAATAFGGAIIGFSIALGGAASNSVSLLDFTIWAAVALAAQLLAFLLVRTVLSDLIVKIKEDKLASGIMVASVSIAIGILNAACMSY